MKPEGDAFYYVVYETEGIEPKLIKIKCSWKWTYQQTPTSSQKSKNVTNRQLIQARFINFEQTINKLVMLLMLFSIQLIQHNDFFIKIKLSYVCMIFFVIENKVEACCIEEQHSRHGNKKVRLDNSSLFTVLRVTGLIKTTLVIFYICFMGYIICKTIVPISHVSFCPLITAYHIP